MKYSLSSMKAATDLTRSGKLLEATALIQRMLSETVAPQSHDPLTKVWQPKQLPSGIAVGSATAKKSSIKELNDKVQSNRGKFENKQFACSLGQRSYKLFTPSGYSDAPIPLIIMLHGCKQTPDDFAVGTQMNELGEELGFFVAYPAQPSSANSMGCWNWFSPGDQQKDKGEPALIAGIARQIMTDHNVDPQRVYVAGLSAGGAMAAVLGIAYPDLFAAIGVHSGLPCGAAADVVSAFSAMRRGASYTAISTSAQPVPTIVFHGDQDRTVNPANADNILKQFDSESGSTQYVTTSDKSDRGMSYSKSVHANDIGTSMFEKWLIHGADHAWSGGNGQGSYTDPRGPDASREMVRFFFGHRLAP